MKELIEENYGGLFEPELIDEIEAVGHVRQLEQGSELMDYGQNIKYMPLLLDGAIKVLRRDDDGDELLLYYLERGR